MAQQIAACMTCDTERLVRARAGYADMMRTTHSDETKAYAALMLRASTTVLRSRGVPL